MSLLKTLLTNSVVNDAREYIPLQYLSSPQTDANCLRAVKANWREIQYVINQTEELCLEAISDDAHALKWIRPECQTETICATACDYRGTAIQYVVKQTEYLINIALDDNANNIRFINNPTYAHYLKAVHSNSFTIKYIPQQHQTEELCRIAIKKNPERMRYIKYPSIDLVNTLLKDSVTNIKYCDKDYVECMIRFQQLYKTVLDNICIHCTTIMYAPNNFHYLMCQHKYHVALSHKLFFLTN